VPAIATPLPIAAVLFDLDGTLADTAGDLTNALNRVRAGRGLPPLPVSALRAYASAGARGLLAAGLDMESTHPDYKMLRDEFLAYYAEGLADTTHLFDGIAPLLDAIEARSLAWGIVTNKAERYTKPVVAALGLDARAGTIVSGDTTPHPKPHPEPLLHAAEALGLPPSACVYVGDDLRDVVAGNAAGMPTIVAKYGYLGDPDTTSEWPATGWIEHPLDLLAWLPKRARR